VGADDLVALLHQRLALQLGDHFSAPPLRGGLHGGSGGFSRYDHFPYK
jgi:hypothetical protein